ncbi:Leucin rich repeat domain containing protein [Pandoravirus dulcis]|uniref:Leucin rich repeat domain containing protein n=1 Tax=Pandoravirus dulcis TaxID=1349409 RepID=S4VR98_9VIRU|nr:Leucin rich repeat domain containing protein [Pandoravirus dulcis]AGO81885.1 Leucin rich repeat domain containing protein [Pandoravirus dulcis]
MMIINMEAAGCVEGKPRRRTAPTLVALALATLARSRRLADVPALRLSRRDYRCLASPDPRSRRPPLAMMHGLVEIRLSNLGLGRVPSALAALPLGLAVLDLSSNRLANLPNWLARFTGLRALDLAANRLTRVPPCVGALTALARLDLSQNRLDAIPAWFGPALVGLRQLNLCSAFERGPRLPPSFAHLASLRHLSLCCSPTLAPGFDSWDDPGADSASHPLWPPVYGLTGLRGLVIHNASVVEVDARIGRLRNLTRIEGLRLAERVPPELAKIRGLAHMDMCNFIVPSVPHEFCALARRVQPRYRPYVDGAADDDDDGFATRYPPRWALPSLVDLCLTALCAMPEHGEDATVGTHRDGRADANGLCVDQSGRGFDWDDSLDECRDVLCVSTSGGGPFVRDRDPGLFYVFDDGDDDDVSKADAALLGMPWYDDRGDASHSATASALPADESRGSHPLPAQVQSLLPIELVERAETAWSRTCASCARPIMGPASLVDMVRARSSPFRLRGRASADPFLGVERAFCPRCAPSAAAAADTSSEPP